MTDFRCHNLVGQEPLPSTRGIDLILCRNVLMYLTPDGIRCALERLHQALAPDGWLLVSPAEAMLVPPELFAATQFPGTTLFRKRPAVQSDTAPAIMQERPMPPPAAKLQEAAPEEACDAGESPCQDVFALYLQGQFSAAKQLGLQRLSACPHDLPTLLLMVRIHANEGQPGAALKWCLTAISQNPQHPAGHYLLALLHQEQGRLDEAVAALTEVLRLDGTFVLGHFALAGIRRMQGRGAEMQRHVEQALVLLDDRPSHEVVAESEGMTAGHLAQILRRFLERREAA